MSEVFMGLMTELTSIFAASFILSLGGVALKQGVPPDHKAIWVSAGLQVRPGAGLCLAWYSWGRQLQLAGAGARDHPSNCIHTWWPCHTMVTDSSPAHVPAHLPAHLPPCPPARLAPSGCHHPGV